MKYLIIEHTELHNKEIELTVIDDWCFMATFVHKVG